MDLKHRDLRDYTKTGGNMGSPKPGIHIQLLRSLLSYPVSYTHLTLPTT